MGKHLLVTTFFILTIIVIYGQDTQQIMNYQKAVYNNLSQVRNYEGIFGGVNPLPYFKNEYYTEQSKIKLLGILRNRWEEKEIDTLAKQAVMTEIENQIRSLKEKVSDTAKYAIDKKRRLSFAKRLDSLLHLKDKDIESIKPYRELCQKFSALIKQKRVDNQYIYVAAMLGDGQYLPALKAAIHDSIHFDTNAVKLALARMGIEPYLSEVTKNYSIKLPHNPRKKSKNSFLYDPLTDYLERSKPLLFICTQKSIKELSKWLNLKYQVQPIADAETLKIPIANYAASDMVLIIQNEDFRLKFESRVKTLDFMDITEQDIEFIKNWLNRNYGKYKLNRDYYPAGLDWRLQFQY